MKNTQSSNDTLAEAMLSLSPFVMPDYEYRVYYDVDTMECTYKTINADGGDNFVAVSREEYDAIEFCPHFIIKKGKVERKFIDLTIRKKLQLSDTGVATVAGYNMFIASPLDTDIEHWTTYD